MNKSMQIIRHITLLIFLFSITAPCFAETLWDQRKRSLSSQSEKRKQIASAFLAPTPAILPISRSLPEQIPSIKLKMMVDLGIKIPESLGTIIESWQPISRSLNNKILANNNLSTDNIEDISSQKNSQLPLIIHIQDAHGIYEAQKNSALILNLLKNSLSKDQPLFVGIEGAWGRIRPDTLSVYPDEDVRRASAENLLRLGEITGEEYLVITEGADTLEIHGVEDKTVYLANLETRKILDARRKKIMDKLDRLTKRLNTIKQKTLSSPLMRLDWEANEYEQGKLSLKDYFIH